VLPVSWGAECGASPSLEVTLSLFSAQLSQSPETLWAAGLGATEGFTQGMAGFGGTVRGVTSGFFSRPGVSGLV
jgi:hypothetical protein